MGKIDFLNCDEFKLIKKLMGISDDFEIVNRIVNNRPIEVEVELHVCKHCLRLLNQQGYNFTYENFSIEEFFRVMNEDNSVNFTILPNENDLTDQLNIYPENWNEISRRLKEKHNYTCQECGKRSPSVQVHHKNELKWDCREVNLEVLCYDCHQAKHNHRIPQIAR